MWSFILLTAAAAVVEANKIGNMGACDHVAPNDGFFDYKQFSEENKGTWTFVKVPSTVENAEIQSMYMKVKKDKSPYQYKSTIYYKKTGDKDDSVFAEEDVLDVGTGHVIATLTGDKTTQFKITFLKYVPGRYAYYYICSEAGGDGKVDYRYVVAHGELTSDELNVIKKLDRQYKFKGKLLDIKPN